jgi:hypothetical protein
MGTRARSGAAARFYRVGSDDDHCEGRKEEEEGVERRVEAKSRISIKRRPAEKEKKVSREGWKSREVLLPRYIGRSATLLACCDDASLWGGRTSITRQKKWEKSCCGPNVEDAGGKWVVAWSRHPNTTHLKETLVEASQDRTGEAI